MVLCVLLLSLSITTVQGKQNERIAGVTDAYYYGTNRSIEEFQAQFHARINSAIQRSVTDREIYSSSWLTADNAAIAGSITDSQHKSL